MYPKDMTCTLPAPPGPPVRSAPVLTATTVRASPTAGELRSYGPARSLSRSISQPTKHFQTHDSLIRTIIPNVLVSFYYEPGLKTLSKIHIADVHESLIVGGSAGLQSKCFFAVLHFAAFLIVPLYVLQLLDPDWQQIRIAGWL